MLLSTIHLYFCSGPGGKQACNTSSPYDVQKFYVSTDLICGQYMSHKVHQQVCREPFRSETIEEKKQINEKKIKSKKDGEEKERQKEWLLKEDRKDKVKILYEKGKVGKQKENEN